MQQQVNLYLPQFRVKKEALTFRTLVLTIAALLGLKAAVFAYDSASIWLHENELAELRASLEVETQKTEQLDDVLARRSQNSALTDRLDAAEARLESSRQIRDFFGRSQLGNTEGFSEYFKDLSRASMDGMSITGFTFTVGGEQAELVGQVADSALVPRYVNNIEQGSSPLRDMHFNPSITRPDMSSRIFAFVLSSGNE